MTVGMFERVGRKKPGNTRYRPLVVPANLNPLVRWVFEEMERQRKSLGLVAKRAGLGQTTISNWRWTNGPSLVAFEAAVNALGYELSVRPSVTRVSAGCSKTKNSELSTLY